MRNSFAWQLEVAVFAAFAFALPLVEGPKNLLWLAWCGLWLRNRARSGDFGGPWGAWDTLLAAWLASGYLVAAFAGLRDDEWGATNDLLRITSVLWLLVRSGYGRDELRPMLAMLIAGTAVTLAWGWWGVYGSGLHTTLGLKSVGHVNHSAIFLAIVFAATLAGLVAAWRGGGTARLALAAATVFFVVSLAEMESRATAGAMLAIAILIPAARARRAGIPLRRPVLAGMLLALAALAVSPGAIDKNLRNLEAGDLLSVRGEIWRGGLLALREYPVFGVGMNNYGRITEDLARGWLERRGEPYDPARYAFSSHAHSLYLNTLVERGVFGMLVLATVLGAWLAAVMRAPPRDAGVLDWAYWGGAAGAFLVAVLVGLVNTTLHHEHALASMLLLGGWLCLARRR